MRKVPDTEKRRDQLNWNVSIKLVKATDYVEITSEKVSDCARCVFEYLSSLEFSSDKCIEARELAERLTLENIGTRNVFDIGKAIMSIFTDSEIKAAEDRRASKGHWILAQESYR
jgi:hypothetical protein